MIHSAFTIILSNVPPSLEVWRCRTGVGAAVAIAEYRFQSVMASSIGLVSDPICTDPEDLSRFEGVPLLGRTLWETGGTGTADASGAIFGLGPIQTLYVLSGFVWS